MKIGSLFRIASFVEVKNDNSTTTFPQGFSRLFQSHLPKSDYQLIDFGAGRKLEQIGQAIVNRPCPGATAQIAGSDLWNKVDLSYSLVLDGQWHYHNSFKQKRLATAWDCHCESLCMQVRPTPAGQVGVFPEHWAHWPWLIESILGPDANQSHNASPPRVLSLFAYTGATTLALAKAGCQVTHVDASKPTVQWAKENSTHSDLAGAATRWIVDDAVAFVKRELRRKKQYDAIILDPPTYGHGAQGDRWEIHRDLTPLLDDCWNLLSDERRAVLLCGHSSHISLRDINRRLAQHHGAARSGECEITQAYLLDQSGRKLDCGFAAKYRFPK
jgi:23S rRNA (cytosine1962-C5)-methyltransferase